jgi:glutamine cyclotransferase
VARSPAEEKKKAVTCMGHEVPGMNELEYVEEMPMRNR